MLFIGVLSGCFLWHDIQYANSKRGVMWSTVKLILVWNLFIQLTVQPLSSFISLWNSHLLFIWHSVLFLSWILSILLFTPASLWPITSVSMKKIMLLKDFKYPIFSVFLFWRNRMRKQTFSIVVLYGMSSGTLCCLDLLILPAASLLVPLFVLWVRIRPCLVLFWHSKEYCVPCICCSHPSMCLKLVVDYKSWPNSRSLKCDKRIWSCRGKEKLSAHFKATENWIVAFPAVIHKMFSNASGVGQSLMLSYFN